MVDSAQGLDGNDAIFVEYGYFNTVLRVCPASSFRTALDQGCFRSQGGAGNDTLIVGYGDNNALEVCPASGSPPRSTSFPSAGRRRRRHADGGRRRRQLFDGGRRRQRPLRLPRVCPPHLSRLRFLPQGNEGNDELTVTGDNNHLIVCPASALPAALDLVFFHWAARATTL